MEEAVNVLTERIYVLDGRIKRLEGFNIAAKQVLLKKHKESKKAIQAAIDVLSEYPVTNILDVPF